MTHQLALTVIAPIQPNAIDSLKMLLGRIAQNRNQPPIIPFDKLNTIHFARLMILDETQDLRGQRIRPSLALLTNFDAPLDAHLTALATIAADELDKVFSHCEGYPQPHARSPQSRVAFLRSHRVSSKPFYVNTPGRTVQQIQQEEQLRQAIGQFVDQSDWPEGTASNQVRSAIQAFVRSQSHLGWALSPAEPPKLSWRLRETLHKVGVPLLLLPFLPLILLGLPIGLVLLRIHEARELPDTSKADPDRVRQLRDDEDFGGQNQIIAIGEFKLGWFRKITAWIVLELADYLIRHVFNRGSLSGLNTIHFARWVTIDQGRRLFFTSNYDGSLESYMNDFIDKAAWGLNAIFSNGEGFPKTRWLFLDGIRDEQAYKTFLPTRQIPTQIWYSAYPHLSTINIQNNAMIRRDLFRQLNSTEIEQWLQRL
ncbi:MAG: hypothetical protein MUF72_21190 [Elainella sp. Prado103]|jgi:hypothetical protein|nr:hypothetical protein [Elainella sp. Prado103]